MSSSKRCWFLRGAYPRTVRQSFRHCINRTFGFQQVPADMCAFGLPFRKLFMLFAVNVPVPVKLSRRCNNFNHVCSFFLAMRIGSSVLIFKIVFFTEYIDINMQYVSLLHLFIRSKPKTIGQTSNAGWAKSLRRHSSLNHQKVPRRPLHAEILIFAHDTVQTCIKMLTNAGRLQQSQLLTRSNLPSSQTVTHELQLRSENSKTSKSSLLRWCCRLKSCTSSSTPFNGESDLSASPLRQARSTSLWASRKCRWTSCNCWQNWAKCWWK